MTIQVGIGLFLIICVMGAIFCAAKAVKHLNEAERAAQRALDIIEKMQGQI